MAALATGTSVRNRRRSARTVALAANSNIPDTVPPLEDLYARGVRLALFSGNYNGVKDGAAVALNRLVAFLERAGVEVLVFSPTIEHAAMEPVGTVVSVRSLPIPRRSEYRIALGLPRAARKRLAAFRRACSTCRHRTFWAMRRCAWHGSGRCRRSPRSTRASTPT